MAKKALGKGLAALIQKQSNASSQTYPTTPVREVEGEQVQDVDILNIVPSPFQPRKVFSEGAIDELAESITQHGIIQPLIVREINGKLELIAGERRWRASQSLNLKTVPIIIREASDQDVLELALIENIQRADLNPIEEALAYRQLSQEFNVKHEEIARQVGKSRAAVANTVRLLELNESVQNNLASKQISVGHAKAILGHKDKEVQLDIATMVMEKKMTVRATERYVQQLNSKQNFPTREVANSPKMDAFIKEAEGFLCNNFSSKIKIKAKGKKGSIEIPYLDKKDLKRILKQLGL